MAVKIRLKKMGSKKRPFYRLIAADSRSPRDGRFLETLGHYNPMTEPAEVKIDEDKVYKWLGNGAQPTINAANLLKAQWPGNIRQLQNLAERVVMQSQHGIEEVSKLLASAAHETSDETPAEKPLKEHVEAFERMLIDNALRHHKGSVAKVMEELVLPRRTLNEKMAKYGLSRSDYL